jgi:SPP1 gp7 family putative phage head morphogenesis protein
MPVTANESLRDALIRHQVYLLRYGAFVRNFVFELLDSTEQAIASKIRDKLRDRTGLTTSADVVRMKKLIETVDVIRNEAWDYSDEWLKEQLESLAVAEPKFAKGIFESESPVLLDMKLPPDRQLISIATAQPFEGHVLKDWAERMRQDDLRRIHAGIQMGMVTGESSDAIARRVVGTGVLNGTDGMTEITRRQVQAITRTAIMSVANDTRDTFFQENADIIDAELFVATLDSRTTAICRALDGKRFLVGEGPRPPLHINCRSLRVAALDGEAIGVRPAKSGTRKQMLDEFASKEGLGDIRSRDDLPRGTKTQFDLFERKRMRELTGQVPAATSYQEWLKTQTKSFQDEVLGKTKAQLFRDGGLSLDKYVAASGTELTLPQLAAKYPDSFRKAGLDPNKF